MRDKFKVENDAKEYMKSNWEKYNDFLDKFGSRVECPLINGTCKGFRCAAWVESTVYDALTYPPNIPSDLHKHEWRIRHGYCKEFGEET